MKIHKNITKKILEILNMIIAEEKKAYNKIIDMNSININKPLTALKELEKIIIFLIDFKNEQKVNNNKEYLNTVKKIEKNKRLLIIKQRKEDDETRIDKKVKKIIQKDMKMLNINNRRINYQYKPSHFKKIVKEETPDKDKDDLDISY
jgi:ribosome maturation factor RimP